MTELKNKEHITIPISVPMFCTAVDAEGTPLNARMNVVKSVSQSAITLEAYREIDSDIVLLSFVDVIERTLEIKGKVVSCTKIESGAFKAEISFQGSRSENIEFAKHLVIVNNRSDQKPETIIERKPN